MENRRLRHYVPLVREGKGKKRREKKERTKNEWKKKLRNPVTELEQRSLQVDRSMKL